MTKLGSVLKSRDITLPTKVCIVKAMVFLVIMYRCESWTIKKADCQRTDAFEMCCWRKLFTVPQTTRRSNQSILKEINHEHALEGLRLKLQYFGHLLPRADWWGKILMLGKIEGKRRRGQQRMRWMDGIANSVYISLSTWETVKDKGSLVCCNSWGSSGTRLSKWTTWVRRGLSFYVCFFPVGIQEIHPSIPKVENLEASGIEFMP